MNPARFWHWTLAILLAITFHLVVYLGLASSRATPPVFRGGGSFGATGNQTTSSDGLLVGLAPPSLASTKVQLPLEQSPTIAPIQTNTPIPTEPSIPKPPVETAKADIPVDPSTTLEQLTAQETTVPEVQLPKKVAVVPSVTPPVPRRKPAPPPQPQPEFELGLLEERLPLEGPAPQENTQSQITSAPSAAAPITEIPRSEISSLRHIDGEGSVGTASRNSEGLVPTLNYKDRILLWIKRHGSYPHEAHRFRQEGTVLLHFVVSRNGEILYYNIRKSSGYFLLDRAVKRMMELSSPVPSIPAQINQDEIEFTIPVVFSRS